MAESKYSQILAKNRIYEAERKQKILQNQQPMQEQVKEDDPGFWESVGATLADVITEPVGGLLKGVEGVIDAGVGFVGGIGDLFGADTEWAEDIVKFDATQNWYYDAFEDKLTEASAVNKAPIVKEIVRGVGQQLPAIALNFIPGVGPALSMTYLGLSAVGGGTEEGLSEDAEMGEAFMYGLAQGGIEFLTEKVTAGLGKGIYSVGKSSAKGIGKVMLEESVSEGIEEGLSALVNPLSKTIYKGADALNSYGDLTFYLDSAQQALVGAAVGGIIGGSSAGIQQRIAGGKQNFMIEQSVKEISALETKENNLWKNKKLDSKQIEKIETQRQAELENIGKQLQNMDEETRKSTIEKYNLSNMFNKDGSIVVESAQEFNGQEIPNINRKPLTTDNMEAYSPNVRNQTLLYAPTSKALSETAINAKDFITTLNSNAKLVISDSMPQNVNAFYDVDSKTFYLSNSATVDTIAGHEFTHSLEGTKEYKKLADYILANTEGLETKIQQKIEQYSEVNKESKSGENGKQVALYEAQTEIVAEEMGKLLSDPKAIERIVNRNKSGAHRIIQWIKDVIAKLTKKGKTGEYYNYLRNAEKLYAKAIKTSIGGVSLSDISAFEELEKLAKVQSENLEFENTDVLDNLTGVRYSKKRNNLWDKLTKQDQALLYKAVGEINNQNYYEYQLENGDYLIDVNNKIIISNGDYLKPTIEGVVEFISLDSSNISKARDLIYENINNTTTIRESVRLVNILCEEEVAFFYPRENSKYDSESSKQRRYSLKNREDSQREERTRGPKTTRYSLSKDSEGNALSENQEKFFKDSMVRDEKGNLLVVYHGTDKEFFVFDNSKSIKSIIEGGLYFTTDEENAKDYSTRQGNKGRIIESYLNLTGYLDLTNHSKEYIQDVIDHIPPDQQELAKELNRDLRDGDFSFIDLANAVYKRNGSYKNACEVMFGWGYDGVKQDNETYVAFESNQIKNTTNLNPTKSSGIRYSLKNSVEEDVLKTFGKTYDWKETGYILKDGTKLDLSGKHEGSVGGRRSVDHREIFDIYEDSDVYGTDAMVEFMGRGNIRVSPEYPGVNIQVEPTQEQYEQIQSMVERLGWKEKAFIVDIDNYLGETIETMEYEGAVSGRKVVADIKYYFKEGKVPYKSRLTDFRYSLVDGQFGKGYSVKDTNIDEYNLVNIKDNENLALFTRLLGQVENVIKNNQANGNTVLLRQNLFKVLSQQENNVYSKLIEINKALNKTQTEYNTNKNINVVQTFIQELGYNGVFVKENNSLGLESVIYNIDKKKRNLLDFSPERAKERLDKAIKLFGETDNPAKAGWLLSDGRFVDYNRDSSNILKETSDDFVLDYRDHFQIEKVYDTKRGYDAIDSFMAEGNIRLMPEVGGIELRNKPKATQLDSLTQYIDTLIDKNGITLDLRKPNTSENVLTNYVYYTADFDSKTIIRDINSFYNNGQMPRVIDGARYSLKDGNSKYDFSKGQIAKYVAEHSRLKAYTKGEAESVINTVVESQLSFGSKYGEISGKTKEQAANTLWHTFNTKDEGFRSENILDIADFIINNAVMEDIYQNDTYEYDNFIVGELKDYLHKIDLSAIKGEIKHHYDTDNSPYLIWGKRSGVKGLSPDQIAQELESRGIKIDAQTEADIFFELDSMYRNSLKNLKKAAKQRLTEIASKEELEELRQNIARELLNSFDENGHKTKFAETLEKYTGKIKNLKQAIKDIKEYNKAKNNLVSTIERLKDEFTKSKPAGWKVPQQVVDFVKTLSKIETWRNNITKTAREHLVKLQSKIDLVMDDTQKSIYPYREVIAEIASGEGELTTQELAMLDNIFRQFAWQLRNYDNVEFEGKVQSNTDLSAQGVKESKQAKGILKSGSNLLIKFKNKVYTNPYDRLAEMGLYRDNSIAMRLYRDMLAGDRRRADLLKETNDLFNAFFDKNKNYLKDLQKEIKIGDISLSKRQALTIYCTSLREQGRGHLFNTTQTSGVIHLLDNKLSIKGNTLEAFAKGKDIDITVDVVNEIKNSLTDADKEYLKLVDTFFNKISKDAKKITDEKLYGITNIEEGYYFPIKVSKDKIYSEAGKNNNDINQYILEMGMNKSTKPNANNKIVIDGIESIVANHLHNLSLYYGYAIPLTAYNRIMNKQVDTFDDSKDITSNMRAEIQKIDPYFEGYMNKLWQDIQGIITIEKGFLSDILSKIRWATANSALGLNPKVLVTQTLSLAAGIAEFNPKYITKGLGHFFGEKEKLELSKYSPLMWERMQIGNSIDIAEIREMSKNKVTRTINDITTKPISWMDSNVIQSLWFAAQYEVADTKGLEFGSEANKIEAGKRLDEVVFRTQQTSDPLGRSEWMRSQNEFVKFARMFTGDALQLTGRLISSVNKYNIAKNMIKSGDSGLADQGQKMLSSAKRDVSKASSAFILNQTMLLAIAMAFKWLKGKNDDEEWSDIAKNELTANLMGLIPFGGDIYDKISGYEPTNMAYTALSNTVDVVTDLTSGITTMIKSDYESDVKRRSTFRKTLLSVSRLFGVPLQNLESYTKGIVGHVSPKTREEYEALFKTKSNKAYLDQIKKATENGDEDLAESIINIMFNSRTGKIKDDRVLDTTRELIEQGYDVIPKSVGKTITYDGVEYTLTDKQHKQFTKIYSQANDTIKKMINLSAFTRMDDEAKAKAMNFIYNYYYNLAIEDMLGEDLESKNLLFAEAVPIEQLAMAVSQAQVYTSDVAKDGKVISGTKKAKVQSFVQSMGLTAIQKYMIMGYLGYSNKFGATLVKTYINRLSLSKTQKQYLYEMSGYGA